MIKNEWQYRVTKTQAEKFEQALEQLGKDGRRMHPVLRKAQIEGIQSQLDDLREEIEEYERLKGGAVIELLFNTFDDILHVLTQARIARGLSQKELGNRLNLKEQQIQRYEATDYASASASRISEVMKALGLKIQGNSILVKESADREQTTRKT